MIAIKKAVTTSSLFMVADQIISAHESLVILEYIDETWKQNPIFPSNPYQRALARFWSKFIDDKIVAATVKVIHIVDDEKEREKNVEESIEALQILENELKDKFFGGEEIGIVDIAAVFIAFWLPLIQDIKRLQFVTVEKFPKLYNWSQEFLNHPIVKENIPPRDPLFASYKAYYDSLIASK
ncbi:putative glutathione S-transferase, variant 2 [Trifolium repens]|nr:putative glutathione S-transferase, variant 2 [Trifolium repens]